jgi:diamine N-acetyltransferase
MIPVTNNGYLRAPEPEDLSWLYRIENDATLWYLGISKEPWSKAVLADYLAAQPGNLQRDGQLRLLFVYEGVTVGAVDLFDYDATARKAGIGIVLSDEYRGKGLGKMMLQAFESYCFNTLALHSLYAHAPINNEASMLLFEQSGYRKVGTLEDWVWSNGAHYNAQLFQKLVS